MKDTDIALRCNVVTVSEDEDYEDKTIIDHSAGEITSEEAAILIEAVRKELEDDEYKFYPGVSYRHLTIWDHGEVVELVPPHDVLGQKIGQYLPKQEKLKEAIQVDYNLPERFDLTYKGADDKMHRPIMIHRAPFGSMERFVAVLLEHTGGKFPLWLSPDQVVVLPISEKFNDYAEKVSAYLNKYDIRSQVDDRNEKIGRKIRDNELKRIPYLLIVGEKEEAEGLVSVRAQGEGDKGQMTLEAFRDYMTDLVSHEIDANKMEQKN